MPVPPGISYLARQLPLVLAPPALVYCMTLAVERFGVFVVPGWLTTIACLLSGPTLLTVRVQYRDYQHRRQAAARGAVMPPALPGSIGGLHMLFRNEEDMYPGEGLYTVFENTGYTVTGSILFQKPIFTADPENIKAILATDFPSFEKGSQFRNLMEPFLGTGVFAADGDMWKFHRQMTRPFFHRERISDFDLFDHHAANAVAQFKARLREGYAADFQDMVGRFTMDTATSFLFGKDMRSLDAGLPYPYNAPDEKLLGLAAHPASAAFATAFQDAQMTTALRTRLGAHWPLAEFWLARDKLKEPLVIVRGVLDPILRDAVAKKRAAVRSGGQKTDETGDRDVQEGETMLEHLVNYTDDHTILRDEILNITTAGRDTTASLLTFAVYMLAEHPDILAKLREEILRVVGPTARPTFDDFRTMKYLRAVLNETLRMYPPVPLNERTSVQPTVFQSSAKGSETPLYVPVGTRCIFMPIIMHRRKDLWGPDALKFDPERFLDERLHKYLTPNPFIFLPFNAGPRICLGQQFAYHEASFFLVRLLQTFSSVSLAADAQPPAARPPPSWKTDDASGWKAHEKIRPRSHLTMFVYGGLWLRMEEAKTAEGN
ncbi:cytochrome P450 [Mycena galopus ATCC 62051]|nr:cytochrome P450 [Mycena galopus ATCC 62051]